MDGHEGARVCWKFRTELGMGESNMRKWFVSGVVAVVAVLSLGAASAVGGEAVREPVTVTLSHPCDLNESGSQDTATEALCLEVWGQDPYEVTHADGSVTSNPAGPVHVIETIGWWTDEGLAEADLRDAFVESVADYSRADG